MNRIQRKQKNADGIKKGKLENSGEKGGTGEYGEKRRIQGNTGERRTQGNAEKHRRIQGNTGEQEDTA